MPDPGTITLMRQGARLSFTLAQDVGAPPDIVWRVMTDHPAYADVASNISKVEVISGAGLGMIRRCAGPKGESWTETCDLFDEGRAFGFLVHTEAADYPYPLDHVQGRWRVTPTGFAIEIDVRAKGSWLTRRLFLWLAPPKFRRVLLDLGQAWAARMEDEAAQSISASARSPARS